jgi:D-aminopeptidase
VADRLRPGPRNLLTDVPGLLVGHAQDAALRTGTTVVTADRPFVTGVHVMGGAPGTRETDALAPGRLVQRADAVVLSGGSAFGLDAASGVVEGLRRRGRGFAAGEHRVPIVPAAILFDLMAGGAPWDEPPWLGLGRSALDAAGEAFDLGTAGAGTGATTGDLKGGLGSASAVLPSGVTVGALVAVNAVGSAVVGGGPCFHAGPWELDGEFGGLGVVAADGAVLPRPTKARGEATTVAVVATDAALDPAGAWRLAVMAHDGLARAIVPAHGPTDGDAVFAVSTAARPLGESVAAMFAIGHAAATCLSRAIARAVFEATPQEGDPLPAWRALHG